MTHADKMIAFLKVGQAKATDGYFECQRCFHAAGQAVVVDGKAIWTCSECGYENS